MPPRSPAPRRRGTKAPAAETVKLRIGNLAKAVLVTGQAYQDPKDALNEFVSNAADEYAQTERRGARIRVILRRKGQRPVIAVDDDGRGMSPDRLRELARNLFESQKAGDDRTLGEKAIGLLAFQQLGERCDIVSRAHDSTETWALTLVRGQATASLAKEKRRARTTPGTTVYLTGIDNEVLRILTQRKVVDYLRSRRGPALARGDYEIEVVEGRTSEMVTPERPDGIKLQVAAHQTLWGRIEFSLYVAPRDGKRRRVAVVGRAGTTIIDDLAEIDEFAASPWTSDQVSGQVVFEALQQSAGRRAILRDDGAFPVFVDAVSAVAPAVEATLEKVAREVDEQTAERLSVAIQRVFGRVLKELADIDNPLRSAFGTEPGEGALLLEPSPTGHPAEPVDDIDGIDRPPGSAGGFDAPPVDSLAPPPRDPIPSPPVDPGPHRAEPKRTSALPSLEADPTLGERRSCYDPDARVVRFNDHHPDYLLVKDHDPSLLDYLATLVAKELVVYNNPRAAPDELGEEMVRMLVRVRRHLPKRA